MEPNFSNFPESSQPRGERETELSGEVNKLERELLEGKYTGILEDYVKNTWPRERIGRDAWQNFFDSNHFTVDGVDTAFRTREDNTYEITLSNKVEYPYSRLLSLGGGFKEDSKRAAGGHHEGTRIFSLMLLRDYQAEEITFGSGDWEMNFYFDTPPEGYLDEKTQGLRGLFMKLSSGTQRRQFFACCDC